MRFDLRNLRFDNRRRVPNYVALSSAAAPLTPLDDFTYLFRLESENASRHVVTTNGNAQLDGSGSVDLETTTSDYLAIPDSNDFDIEAGDYTVDFYAKQESASGAYFRGLISHDDTGGTRGWLILSDKDNGNKITIAVYNGATSKVIASTSTLTNGVWTHIEVVVDRANELLRLFINGVGTSLDITGFTPASTANVFRIGCLESGGAALANTYFDGMMSRLHVSKGIARHTANFTPPLRTDPITVDANTVLALNFVGTAASTRIIDSAVPADSGAVGILPDISGNENDIVQATAGSQPLFNTTLQALTFDGTDDFMARASFVQAQPFTLYFVADMTADTVAQILFGDTNAYAGLTSDEFLTANAGSAVSDSADHSGSKKLFAVDFNGASSVLYVNGSSVATGTLGSGALAAFGIGANSAGTSPAAMDFYAAFMQSGSYDASLNASIADKYGVSV